MTLVGTLLLVIGFLSILEGYLTVLSEDTLLGMDPQALGAYSALVGIALMICGLASFYGTRPVWYISLAIIFLAMINSLLTVPEGLVRFVLLLVVISYLNRPQVKEHFGILKQTSPEPKPR